MSFPPPLRLAAFLPCSRANGPGLRAVVWVQGCALRCPGCFNPGFLPLEDGTRHEPTEIAERILSNNEAEGVTFSGGEPFLQAAALAGVARLVHEAGRSVVIFTGCEWEKLEHSTDPSHKALLAQTDTLIAGPYRKDEPSSHPLLASGNQRLVHLTGRYTDEDFLTPIARRTEFRIAVDGTTTVSGFPAPGIRHGPAETI
jgi:anaerobic ribonucleoside-triphosphate reductase activating protein